LPYPTYDLNLKINAEAAQRVAEALKPSEQPGLDPKGLDAVD
jgi:hypothetical protein